MSKDYRMHPVFGILTDPEEIAIFDRHQAEEDMERAYWEDQQQAEYEEEKRVKEQEYHQEE